MTKANTSQANANTNKRDALVVDEIWLIILPDRPTVTDPTGVLEMLVKGELTVILGRLVLLCDSFVSE